MMKLHDDRTTHRFRLPEVTHEEALLLEVFLMATQALHPRLQEILEFRLHRNLIYNNQPYLTSATISWNF
jgi:hypothetical protein